MDILLNYINMKYTYYYHNAVEKDSENKLKYFSEIKKFLNSLENYCSSSSEKIKNKFEEIKKVVSKDISSYYGDKGIELYEKKEYKEAHKLFKESFEADGNTFLEESMVSLLDIYDKDRKLIEEEFLKEILAYLKEYCNAYNKYLEKCHKDGKEPEDQDVFRKYLVYSLIIHNIYLDFSNIDEKEDFEFLIREDFEDFKDIKDFFIKEENLSEKEKIILIKLLEKNIINLEYIKNYTKMKWEIYIKFWQII